MAIEPRQIAGMVEGSMGAGGQVMPEEDSLQIDLPETINDLPEGIELADEEAVEIETEEYRHDANLAEVLDESVLGDLSSDIQAKFREDIESREDWEEAMPKVWGYSGLTTKTEANRF